MKTESWALFVSIIALAFSVGIPIWQARQNHRRVEQSQRTLLLQKILEAKSLNYGSGFELRGLLDRHQNQMEDLQRQNLEAMIPRIQDHHAGIEELYVVWDDPDYEPTFEELQDGFRIVEVIRTEAKDTSDLITRGVDSYR